ncbi:2958_t:CDS:2 [Dentiscutata heterogama]|uniref:2958_t:CDS:1 n=1 Tax=Dentiscutata heterogama TaxID=1316150 RepID=A0ACA9M6A6_9GLOM|nr:2958_t:CDS:2 [Dentiscutata heterogama]
MPTIAPNASAQRQALELIQDAKSKISEYETLLIHTTRKQNTNQTFAQPSIESTTDMLSAHLIYPSSSTMTYLSAEEVNKTLDSFDTQQIKLSNAAILEDFTNLLSLGLSHKFETSNLLEALSDIE